MKVRTFYITTVSILLGSMVVVGCAPQSNDPSERGLIGMRSGYVELPDGRVVVCVTVGDGVTCDWDTAAREGEQ